MCKLLFRAQCYLVFVFCCFSVNTIANTNTKPLNVMLDWYPNINHAPLFLAQQNGFFKSHDLQVNIHTPSDPTEPPKLIAAGKIDIAIDYLPNLLIAQQHHYPVKWIGNLINQPLGCLVVLQQKNIDTIEQLRGKKIAYSSPVIDLLVLQTMLNKHGLSLRDVNPINVHYGLAQALLSGQVDAAIGMMRNVEPIQFNLMQKQVIIFQPERHGVPIYPELVFIANQDKTQEQNYQAFLSALKESIEFIKKNPQQAWQILIKAYPELNNELNKTAWQQTLAYFADNPGQIDAKQTQQVLHWIKQKVD